MYHDLKGIFSKVFSISIGLKLMLILYFFMGTGYKCINANNFCNIYADLLEQKIALANSLLQNAYYKQSLVIYEQVLPLLEQQPNKHLAETYFDMSCLYAEKKDFFKAKQFINKGITIQQKLENYNTKVLADMQLYSAYLLMQEGSYNESNQKLIKYIDLHNKFRSENDTLLYYPYLYLSNNYRVLGEYELGLNYLHKIEKICQLKKQKISQDLANTYYTLGLTYYLCGNYSQSINNYRKQAYVSQILKNYEYEALAYGSIGMDYRMLGEFDKSLMFYQKAIRVYEINKKANSSRLAILYNNVGNLCIESNNLSLAWQYLEQSEELRKNKPNEMSSLYLSKANWYLKNNKFSEAEILYGKALWYALNFNKNEINKLINIYSQFSEFCLNIFQNNNSLRLSKKAIAIIKQNYGMKHPKLAENYGIIGDYYSKNKNFKEALKNYNFAVESVLNGNIYNDVFSAPNQQQTTNPLQLLNSIKKKAQCLFNLSREMQPQKYLLASANHYEYACKLLENTRFDFESMESKLRFTNDQKEIYDQYLQVLQYLHKTTSDKQYLIKMFEISERSKAGVLRQSIRTNIIKRSGLLPDSILLQEKFFNDKTLAIYNQLSKNNNAALSLKLQDSLFLLKNLQTKLMEQCKTNFPNYFKNVLTTTIKSVSEVRESLANNQAFIEYSMSDTNIFAFYIDKQNYKVENIKIDCTFNQNFDLFQDLLREKILDNFEIPYYQVYLNTSNYLYQKLLEPFAINFVDKRLKIIPDGKLAYLPFEALTNSKGEKYKSFAELPYVIKKNSISYAYTASIDEDIKTSNSINQVLAYAPSYPKLGSNILFANNQVIQSRNNFCELKGAKREVESITQIMQTKMYLGNNATKNEFFKNCNDYKIIHLALHAIVDDSVPDLSKLIFKQEGNLEDENEIINANEIYNLKLNAKMVVLSACNTGNGKICKGEGVMSMARAFFYAGCSSVILTLWSQNDDAGAEIIPQFYKNIHAGCTKDIALQKAKIDYLKNCSSAYAHPYYWAGYVQIGKEEKLEDGNLQTVPYSLAFVLVPLIGFGIFSVRKKI